jgi:hypothetical protein
MSNKVDAGSNPLMEKLIVGKFDLSKKMKRLGTIMKYDMREIINKEI